MSNSLSKVLEMVPPHALINISHPSIYNALTETGHIPDDVEGTMKVFAYTGSMPPGHQEMVHKAQEIVRDSDSHIRLFLFDKPSLITQDAANKAASQVSQRFKALLGGRDYLVRNAKYGYAVLVRGGLGERAMGELAHMVACGLKGSDGRVIIATELDDMPVILDVRDAVAPLSVDDVGKLSKALGGHMDVLDFLKEIESMGR